MDRVFLIRHGHVDKANKNWDTLNEHGVELANQLPKMLIDYGANITSGYYDNEDGERCKNTINPLKIKLEAYGDRAKYRNINEVLHHGRGDFVACYRAPNIECGSLYHVKEFEMHTHFHDKEYLRNVRERMKLGYEFIFVLLKENNIWRQIDKIPTGYDYYGKI